MKKISIYSTMLLLAFLTYSCDAIEDESLREDEKSGSVLTKEDLKSALEVTQPFANKDGVVEGDQYIVVNNKRPETAGTWYLDMGAGKVQIAKSNQDTIIANANGTFGLYYMAVSKGEIIKTDPIQIEVTNVFDEYSKFLSGAKDKADLTAKKTWEFVGNKDGHVCYMGAHGAWKFVDIWGTGIKWWAEVAPSSVAGETMVFEFNENKFITYKADGTVRNQGTYDFNHDVPETKVAGVIKTTVPFLGGRFDDFGQVSSTESPNVFWILQLDDKKLVVYHATKGMPTGVDWSDCSWWAFYKVKE